MRSHKRYDFQYCTGKLFYCVYFILSTVFQEANILSTVFQEANILSTLFQEANILSTVFQQANILSTLFQEANILSTVFQKANILSTMFQEANILSTVFQETNILSTVFQEANVYLTGSIWIFENQVFHVSTISFGYRQNYKKQQTTLAKSFLGLILFPKNTVYIQYVSTSTTFSNYLFRPIWLFNMSRKPFLICTAPLFSHTHSRGSN